MPKYAVLVEWVNCGTVFVTADSEEEAREEVDDGGLPMDGTYMDGSFQVLTVEAVEE